MKYHIIIYSGGQGCGNLGFPGFVQNGQIAEFCQILSWYGPATLRYRVATVPRHRKRCLTIVSDVSDPQKSPQLRLRPENHQICPRIQDLGASRIQRNP